MKREKRKVKSSNNGISARHKSSVIGEASTAGITLIALVITIIVLLILAGITINLTIGQDGILKRAEQAGRNYTNAADYEREQIAGLEKEADDIIANLTGDNNTAKTGKLTEIITAEDYGKTINYSVTVKNSSNEDVTLTDWKVFYNDKDTNNVYIILSDYLDNSLIPSTTKMITNVESYGKYVAYWSTSNLTEPYNKSAVETLINTDIWKEFATGKGGETATGSPTLEMYVSSWNAKGYTKLYTSTNDTGYYIGTSEKPTTFYVNMSTDTVGYADTLYYLHTSAYENCSGYWLASPSGSYALLLMIVAYDGNVNNFPCSNSSFSARPVVCLQSGVTGSVGDSISID